MKEQTVELIRRFTPIHAKAADLAASTFDTSRTIRWNEIEREHRVLILADVGAGKTFEARERARRLRNRRQCAFFIRIEAIDAEFEAAFEIGSAADFKCWLTSVDEGYFFLDSVDEAQLGTPRALEEAIRIFGTRIHAALARARIFITSRLDAWQALPDQTLVEQYLPYGAPVDSGNANKTKRDERDPMLKIFHMDGLSDEEIALFASHHGVGDVAAFVDALRRSNLTELAQRPFDLKALVRVWIADQALGRRVDVLQRLITLQLKPQRFFYGRQLDPARARVAVRTLAAAVTLTGSALISMPNDLIGGSSRINPQDVLPDWNDEDLVILLRAGLFDDIVYSSVRFRHREIRELLTAEWAYELMQRADIRARVEHLFIRTSYGEQVLVPRLRPTLTWLILFDPEIRDRALAIDPEVATEGGDPSMLPLTVRRALLAQLVQRITSGGDL